MGSPDGNNGGWPSDGGLPELPPEWRDVVIPDDPSALAAESSLVRAEMRQERRQERTRRIVGPATAGLRAPLLIMGVAVLVTLASLFAAAWPGANRPPSAQRSTGTLGRALPALDLVTADGQVIALRSMLPAVVLLTDGCVCDQLADAAVAAVPPGVTVVTVTGRAPTATGSSPTPAPAVGTGGVRALHDPTGGLRTAFDLPPPDGTAAALLVSADGTVVRATRRTVSIEDLRPDLARL